MKGQLAKLKVIALVIFVSLTAVSQSYIALGGAILLLLGLILAAQAPLSYYSRRLIWLLPFVVLLVVLYPFITPGKLIYKFELGFFTLSATHQGLLKAGVMSLRVLTALLAGLLLTATTSSTELLQALRALKIPQVLVALMEFTIRYGYVLTDELQRMQTARKARGFVPSRGLWQKQTMKTLGQLLGILFVRAWERGNRVYEAMLARGYQATNSGK